MKTTIEKPPATVKSGASIILETILETILRGFEPAVAEAKKDVLELTQKTAPLRTPNEREALFNLALGVSQRLKGTDKKRKDGLEPLNDIVKGVNAFIKSKITEPVEAAISAAKVQITDFDRRLAQEQEEERHRIAKAKKAQEDEAAAESKRIADETAQRLLDAKNEADRKRREEIDKMEPGPEKAAAIRELNGETESTLAAIEAEGENLINHNEVMAHTANHAIAAVEDRMDSEVGRGIVKKWKFTVTDSLALATARPDLVKIEPKTRDITSEIAAGVRDIPGLLIEPDNGVVLR